MIAVYEILEILDEPLYVLSNPPPRAEDEVPPPSDPDIVVTARRNGDSWSFTGVTYNAQGVPSAPFDVAALEPGDVPDIIEWSRADQPRENIPASPLLTIVVVGNTVIITGEFTFVGAGANPDNISRMLAIVNTTWTNAFGPYTVLTSITEGPGGIVVRVPETHLGNQFAQLGGSEILTLNLAAMNPDEREPNERKFAHEFGHILGLMDLYGWSGSEHAPGYESGIMGGAMTEPTEQNIRDLLEANGF